MKIKSVRLDPSVVIGGRLINSIDATKEGVEIVAEGPWLFVYADGKPDFCVPLTRVAYATGWEMPNKASIQNQMGPQMAQQNQMGQQLKPAKKTPTRK